MVRLLSKLHLFIFLYASYSVYITYVDHETKLEELTSNLPVLQQKINKTKKEKKQLAAYYKEESKAKAKIEKVAKEIEKLQKQFPSKIDDNLNIQTLTNLSQKLNLRNASIRPLVEKDKGFYFIKEYQVKGRGTFLQFLIFFEKIEILSAERLLNIGSLKFAKIKEKQKGRFQLIDAEFNIQAYRYNKNYHEDRGIEAIEKSSAKKSKIRKKKNRKI